MDNFRIKTLTPDEWELYRSLRLRSIQADPQAFGKSLEQAQSEEESAWRNRLDKDPHVFLEDIERDMLVGMAGAFSNDGKTFMINQMWIDPIARGKGNGRLVLEGIIREVQSRGATKVTLFVNVNQSSAVGLYEKLGFQVADIVKEQKMGDGSVVDEYVMNLELN